MTTTDEILALGSSWAAAEQVGDTDTLDRLAADGFRLVGPFGFVLDKAAWLDRYRSGDLVTDVLDWHDVSVADHGDVAIAIGTQTQQAAHRGRRSDGDFRVSQVFHRDHDGWSLIGMQLSLGGPPAPA